MHPSERIIRSALRKGNYTLCKLADVVDMLDFVYTIRTQKGVNL